MRDRVWGTCRGVGRCTQQLGRDLKPIQWGLKLEDYRASILCKNCPSQMVSWAWGAFIVLTGAWLNNRITKGWHKFTSSLSPSNKTDTLVLCTPVGMKQPVLIPGNDRIKRQKVHHHLPPLTHNLHVITAYFYVQLHSSHFRDTTTTIQSKPASGFQSYFRSGSEHSVWQQTSLFHKTGHDWML